MRTRSRTVRRSGGRDGAAASLPQVLAAVRLHHPSADVSVVEHAHAEAARWHAGQTRRSGDPYVTHCVAVAAVVADAGMPPAVVCAAMLHDITDTLCPPGRVVEHFGPDVARLIADVVAVKLTDLPVGGLDPEAAGPTGRPTHEEAVLAIRLADRLHNLRTIEFLVPAKQHRTARETVDVFAPLARAAGLTDMSRELRVLSTAVLRPASSAVSARVLSLITALLPSAHRARWREEWHAELTCLPSRGMRARFTLRVLLGTPRLSLTLRRWADLEGS